MTTAVVLQKSRAAENWVQRVFIWIPQGLRLGSFRLLMPLFLFLKKEDFKVPITCF